MNAKFKIGDLVYGVSLGNERISTIVEIIDETYLRKICGTPITNHYDVVLQYHNGETRKTEQCKLMLVDDAMLDLDGKSKWEVNSILGNAEHKVRMDNGYFGSYSLIDYKGKQCIVYCDDRNAKVVVKTNLYDKVYLTECGGWSGDYRWNSDKPIVVYNKRKGYNMLQPHCGLLMIDTWLKSIETHWLSCKAFGYYLNGVDKKGNQVFITPQGSIRLAEEATAQNLDKTLQECKNMPIDQISKLWIEKGMPCAFIRGLEYKGARASKVSKERAIELFKTHHGFGNYFQSAEWRILDGQVTLLFREYADSDYD